MRKHPPTVVIIELKCATEIGAEKIDRCRDYAGVNTKLVVLGTFPGIGLQGLGTSQMRDLNSRSR